MNRPNLESIIAKLKSLNYDYAPTVAARNELIQSLEWGLEQEKRAKIAAESLINYHNMNEHRDCPPDDIKCRVNCLLCRYEYVLSEAQKQLAGDLLEPNPR